MKRGKIYLLVFVFLIFCSVFYSLVYVQPKINGYVISNTNEVLPIASVTNDSYYFIRFDKPKSKVFVDDKYYPSIEFFTSYPSYCTIKRTGMLYSFSADYHSCNNERCNFTINQKNRSFSFYKYNFSSPKNQFSYRSKMISSAIYQENVVCFNDKGEYREKNATFSRKTKNANIEFTKLLRYNVNQNSTNHLFVASSTYDYATIKVYVTYPNDKLIKILDLRKDYQSLYSIDSLVIPPSEKKGTVLINITLEDSDGKIERKYERYKVD